jgi:hypothetical protein
MSDEETEYGVLSVASSRVRLEMRLVDGLDMARHVLSERKVSPLFPKDGSKWHTQMDDLHVGRCVNGLSTASSGRTNLRQNCNYLKCSVRQR